MSEQDELIAKVRKLSEAATAGPWATPNYPDVVESGAGHRVAEASAGNYVDDAKFIAESRTLLPALADLAESEGRRADEAEARRQINEELLGDNMEILARVRRALKPTAQEAPFKTDAVAVARAGLLQALQQEQSECLGFLAGLGYEGTLVRAVVALADRATELKHERNAALAELTALKGQQS